MGRDRNRKGFTLVELLIICLVIALLIIGSMFWISRSNRERHCHRAICSTNLNGMGKALVLYASTNKDKMPSMAKTENWTLSASAKKPVARNTIDEFWEKEKGCNLQAYWLLVNEGFMSEKSFRCNFDKNYKEKDPKSGEFGFDSWANCSYGLQIVDPGYHSSLGALGQSGSVIIAGDQPELKKNAAGIWGPDDSKRPGNHDGEYMNMLSVSSSVSNASFSPKHKTDWYKIGYEEDDIFDYDPTGQGKAPNTAQPNDSYLFQSK